MRDKIANNENTPVSVLQKLGEDQDSFVRGRVAENKNTPVSLLEKLAEDESFTVRKSLIPNKNIPVSLLEKLAKDEDEWVRRDLVHPLLDSYYKETPVSLLEKLVEDESELVRTCVADNNNTPVSLLEKLEKDVSKDVSKKARKNLKARGLSTTSPREQEEFISLELEASDCNIYSVDYSIEEIKNSLDLDWCKGFIDAMQSESLSNYGEDPLISFDGSSIKISKNTEPFNLKKGEIRIFGFWEYDERSTDYEYLEWARNSKITSHSIEIYPGTFFVEKFTDSNGEELNFQLEGAGGEAYYNLGVADYERNLELECTSEPEDLLRMVSTILKK